MTYNNHELLTSLFNTNTDIAMTNDFSSILNNSLYFEESFDRKNICSESSCTYTDVCIRCEQNWEFEMAQTIDKQKDLQQDNDNDSIGDQLVKSNEGNHLMQQKVPSPLASATVPLEPSVIDVWESRIEHFSRAIHQPIRFRLSIGSPSLFLVGASNNSDNGVAEENAAEMPKFLKIQRLAIKEDLIRNFKGNEVSTY